MAKNKKKIVILKGKRLDDKILQIISSKKSIIEYVEGDPLGMPRALKREGARMTPTQLSQYINPRRDWIMPKGNTAKTKTKEVEQPEINTVSAALPVEVNYKPLGKPSLVHNFEDLAGFEEWFNPDLHKIEGSIADASVTMIAVEEIAREVVKANKRVGGKLPPEGKDTARVFAASSTNGPSDEQKQLSRGAVVKRTKAIPGKKPNGLGTGRGGHNAGQAIVRHGCKVNGGKEIYGSVYKAFLDLRLDVSKHVKFRGALKVAKGGKHTYEEGGKKYNFELTEMKK